MALFHQNALVAHIEQDEWNNYFNEEKSKADELKSQISQTDHEIDAMVYELYGLSEEERKVVKGG
ncbi:MAG: hypothetical protein WEA58_15610 [Balneolaceae bacterium]